jgi:hypothetical protein
MRHLKVLHSGRLWPYSQILDWPKKLPMANTLAYFNTIVVTKKKSFFTITTGTNVIKLFMAVSYAFSY